MSDELHDITITKMGPGPLEVGSTIRITVDATGDSFLAVVESLGETSFAWKEIPNSHRAANISPN